jgi:hypothetical protein
VAQRVVAQRWPALFVLRGVVLLLSPLPLGAAFYAGALAAALSFSFKR